MRVQKGMEETGGKVFLDERLPNITNIIIQVAIY